MTLGHHGIFRSLVTYFADGGTLSLNFDLRGTYRPVYYESILGSAYPGVVFICGGCRLGFAKPHGVWTLLHRHWLQRGCGKILGDQSRPDQNLHLRHPRPMCCAGDYHLCTRLGSASATTGVLWELEAIAAVIIGGTVLKGGYGRIGGTILGALILTTIGNILNFTDLISNYLNGTMQGLIIIVAVWLQRGSWGKKKNKTT